MGVRNVVFDMGGVLMEWNPLKLARFFVDGEEDARLIAREVFCCKEWSVMDAGALTAQTVAWAAQRRLPAHLAEAAEQAALHWYEHRTMMPHMDGLIVRLKQKGYGIYLLSNAGVQFSEYCESLPAFECFDGRIVSAFEHVVKPDPAIYQLLCERYGLDPTTCLFIDDVEAYAEGAKRVGMQGFAYKGDPEALEAFIHDVGDLG